MNAGAILNRINFGMAVAANKIPGARVNSVPGLDTLASSPRAKQVDAVVSLMLNGSISPDTRGVLMSGENPLVASGTAVPAPLAAETSVQPADDGMMQAGGNANARNTQLSKRNQRQGQQNPLGTRNGAVPQLNGIAQVIGLALGSPEFQRH